MVRMMRHLLPQQAHVLVGEKLGECSIRDIEPAQHLLHALERGQLAPGLGPRRTDLALDGDQRLREVRPRDRRVLRHDLVQRARRRREAPPVDLDRGQAVHVQIDERVEQIEDDGADGHGKGLRSRASLAVRFSSLRSVD